MNLLQCACISESAHTHTHTHTHSYTCSWQDTITELVQQIISSNLSATDDSSCHDTALRRSRGHRIEHRIRAKITEVQNDICTWLNAAAARKIKLEQLPVTDDQVCDSKPFFGCARILKALFPSRIQGGLLAARTFFKYLSNAWVVIAVSGFLHCLRTIL